MYNYQTERPNLFTEKGQELFLRIRDNATRRFANAKYVDMGDLIQGHVGSTWDMMACVDRMVELRELREVPTTPDTPGQCRIFKHPNS